ncbi:MAG: TetR/AcrR family transcriptional regulator [Candidatus Bipolaricaulota bacterium]|nr:TetR/AcrR family transcriptional regulator [Candidatus Bipolaricaulota bacterium]
MPGNNKDKLIRQAAIRVFAREGFHQARMETIAHEAGVAVGTIYNYFESKRDVLLAVFEAEFEEQISFFEGLRKSGLSIPEQIAQILQGHFSLLREKTELAQVLLQERFNPGKGFKEKLSNFHHKVVERIESLIREGIDQGWVRSCDPRIIAPALFAVVQSIGSWEMIHSETVVGDLFQTAPTELADFIWKGLRKGEDA